MKNNKKKLFVLLGIAIVVILLIVFKLLAVYNTGLVEIEGIDYEENYCDSGLKMVYMKYIVDGKTYIAYDIPIGIFDYDVPLCDCEYPKTIIRYNKKKPNKFMSIDFKYSGDTEGKNKKTC